jgi:hypothetical protein
MGKISFPETSVLTTLHCAITEKTEEYKLKVILMRN